MDKNSATVDAANSDSSSLKYITPGYLYGINTTTTSLGRRPRNFDISSIPTPKIHVSPWLDKSFDCDSVKKL